MKVLVLNCGSSSLKFQVIEPHAAGIAQGHDHQLARGLVERIGGQSQCAFVAGNGMPYREASVIADHADAVRKALGWLDSWHAPAAKRSMLHDLDAVGHRIVHGGHRFSTSVVIDEQVLAALDPLSELAPLHNPPALAAMRACRAMLGPSVPMVAAFDTAFHQTLPDYASAYALPYDLAERYGIRRYGFHGLAHRYIALRYAALAAISSDQVNIITLHLGNGCSACAIQHGKSVDTSMGFTPLEGLVMGTRTGDLDAAVVSYLVRRAGVSVDEVEAWLNERSGLLGVSGRSNDMRELLAHMEEDTRTALAVELFCYRARKYVGAYLAVLGGAQALVFSGGIGEHSWPVRAKICEGLQWCGLEVDPERNTAIVGAEGCISRAGTPLPVYVIPSDEEVLIAHDTATLLLG